MVNLLLGGMKWVSAVGYIDDIIVYSDTWDAHRAHLWQLFQALRDANLQLHPGKRSFGAAAVRYLGHIVSRDGIKPCPSKVEAILDAYFQNGQGRETLPRQMPVLSQLRARKISRGRLPSTPPGARCARLSAANRFSPTLTTRPPSIWIATAPATAWAPSSCSPTTKASVSSHTPHARSWTTSVSGPLELEAAALIWALETFRHCIDTIEVCIRTDHSL
ncbi:hypothetical protein Emag_007461 [Eimeria magna]